MDAEELYQQARQRFDHESARRVLREKYQARLIFGHAGGMFRATPDMIVFLDNWPESDIVIQDLYENPVRVDARALAQDMRERWQAQMNAWLAEHEAASQQR